MKAILVLALLSSTAAAADAIPSFPGAEGFGSTTPGGRSGQVLLVTTLDDYRPKRDKPIAGSLRAAVESEGPRIVVFRVSGLIDLKAPLVIANPFITIAGQSAPGEGVCLKRFNVQITAHDAVVRYLRVRPGDESEKQLDGLAVYKTQNVVVDHCSAGWSVDESLSVTGDDCTNVTVQWCLIAESLNESKHDKGEHGYGSLVRTDGDITFHHNVYAHHKTRCPRPGTYGAERGIVFDFRNNLIYDWVSPAGYSAEDKATMNYVGNYLKPGPSTKDRKHMFKVGGAATTMYVADNFLLGNDKGNADNWELINGDKTPETRLASPLPVAPVRADTAEALYPKLLAGAGASLPKRDAVDARIIKQIADGTGRVINSPNDVGGWPVYPTAAAPADVDADGQPDAWEREHGLNPADPADGRGDLDRDGYTNLEEFLNGTDPKK